MVAQDQVQDQDQGGAAPSAAASSSTISSSTASDNSLSTITASSAPTVSPDANSASALDAASALLGSLGINLATLTSSAVPYTTITESAGLATPTVIVLDKNQTEALEQAHTCWYPEAVGITLQNATSWNATGCHLGFWCKSIDLYLKFLQLPSLSNTHTHIGPNNTVNALPQYCPPFPECQIARNTGGTCYPSQGRLEPELCPAKSYCPPPGLEQIICPEGYFCPRGSYEPLKCTVGSHCPPGTMKDMSFLPMVLLFFLDAFLITAAVIIKIKQRFFAKHQKKHSFRASKPAKALASKVGIRGQYQEVGDPEAPAPYGSHNGYEMEPRVNTLRHRPTGFEMLGNMRHSVVVEHFTKAEEVERSDLHLFVESLSKCLGNSNFGLSFDFEDLRFQPAKSPKPILSEVTGRIGSGSLWGVMGASGAGKCELKDILCFQSLN